MPALPLPDDPAHLREIVNHATRILDYSQKHRAHFERLLAFARLAKDAESEADRNQYLALVETASAAAIKDWEPCPDDSAILPYTDLPALPPDYVAPSGLERLDMMYKVVNENPLVILQIHDFTRQIYQRLVKAALTKLSVIENCESQNATSAAPPSALSRDSTLTELDSDRVILETLRAVGHRVTTSELLTEMTKRDLSPSDSTVKKRLAQMVKDRRVDNKPKAKPKGYGLPGWNGSVGSSGS
jgi:hypothetical protein